jgi:hypothetical protein
MAHNYGVLLYLPSKATYTVRISPEAHNFVYQNPYQLRLDNTNFALA